MRTMIIVASFVCNIGCAFAQNSVFENKGEALKHYSQFVTGGWTYSAMESYPENNDGWTRLIHRREKFKRPKIEQFGFCAFSLSGNTRTILFRSEDTQKIEFKIRTGSCEHVEIQRRSTFLAREKNNTKDDVLLFFKSFGYPEEYRNN